MRHITTFALCAALGATTWACTEEDGAVQRTPVTSLTGFYEQEVEWQDCDDGFECASLRVPVDYANPDGDEMTLPLIRKAVTGEPGERLGSLILNFGGPGGPGISGLRRHVAKGRFTTLGERYDLVSFDPRGVGMSDPAIACLQTKAELDETDKTPDDAEEVEALRAAYEKHAEECASAAEGIVPFVGTESAAKDVDVLRAVVGDEKLSYLGFSYGTFLGAAYAHQFPDRVGRLVLDGTLAPGLSAYERALGQARGFQLAFENFAGACVERGDCPLGDSVDEIVAKTFALQRSADEKPLPAGSETLTEAEINKVLTGSLYSEKAWPELEAGLAAAFDGDGTRLYEASQVEVDIQNIEMLAVTCADTTERPEPDDVVAALPVFASLAPLFMSSGWAMLGCSTWPFSGSDAVQDVSAEGAAPILTIGTTGDPATPLEWTPPFADALGVGVLLYREGEGHCAYGSGNPCIDDAVEEYLFDGELPESGKVCPAPEGDDGAVASR